MRFGTKMLLVYGVVVVVLGIGFGRYLYSYKSATATTGSTAQGDSSAIAAQAYAQCGQLALDEKEKCYERILLSLVAQNKVRLAMGSLHLIGERDIDVNHFSHQYAHGIGIAS